MKKYLLLVWGLLFFTNVNAEETLFSGNLEYDGFGGPVFKVTNFCDETAVLAGGRGGVILGHQLIIGGGGYGTSSSVKLSGVTMNNMPVEMDFSYGGFEVEYIKNSGKLLHYSVYCLIGGGEVEYTIDNGEQWNDNVSKLDEVFVIEPAINATLNVTDFFRISAGMSYRHINGMDSAGLQDSDLSGPSFTATLRFGSF